MEAAQIQFPWRQLGELLVDEQLLTETELELALEEQARTGRLLGQIVVDRGYLSAFSLARVLSEQHSVHVHEPEQQAAPAPTMTLADPPEFGEPETSHGTEWKPLGKLLLEKGFLTAEELNDALAEQHESHGRLGEILVSRGFLTGTQLARTLADQQGVELESQERDLEATVVARVPDEPMYKVIELTFQPGFQERATLYESPSFLEAADYAFEFIQDHDPAAVEIQRTHGAAQETVWNYSASRAAAASVAQRSLVDTFGFDPTKWGRS
jgi:hypothetical protein